MMWKISTEKSSVIGGYASLRYSEDTQSDEATTLLTRISKFGSDIENRLLFFDLWWKKQVDEKNARSPDKIMLVSFLST